MKHLQFVALTAQFVVYLFGMYQLALHVFRDVCRALQEEDVKPDVLLHGLKVVDRVLQLKVVIPTRLRGHFIYKKTQ